MIYCLIQSEIPCLFQYPAAGHADSVDINPLAGPVVDTVEELLIIKTVEEEYGTKPEEMFSCDIIYGNTVNGIYLFCIEKELQIIKEGLSVGPFISDDFDLKLGAELSLAFLGYFKK